MELTIRETMDSNDASQFGRLWSLMVQKSAVSDDAQQYKRLWSLMTLANTYMLDYTGGPQSLRVHDKVRDHGLL